MCTAKCSRFIAGSLYPLAFISMVCNVLLFFPDWSVKYVKDDRLTPEVKYMGGVVGGGVMVLVLALFVHLTLRQGCCANRCGMFLSIAFAALGAAGALYSFVVAMLGLVNGPYCKYASLNWGRPFKGSSEYLTQIDKWSTCTEPKNVVELNVGLFVTLVVVSSLELVLCLCQMINGLVGCICGANI
ncbi:transmembrane 4 L6 family member 1-like [Pygocentrus nattereri]|uniref:Uncharacterized protein n=1 Tax=Pygocentrus nattereri TaxID=42514 RepID=A0A3B4C0D8_PYGNA|nr:transmembrane 4 L6 family member 1-like [Pygocentrus nattereri]